MVRKKIITQLAIILPLPLKRFLTILLRLPVKLKTIYAALTDKKLTQSTIIKQLKSFGVKEGSVLFVHSSLAKLGYVDGGAETIIEALLQVIGQTGTLVMPAFSWAPLEAKDYLNTEKPVFSCLTSASKMGKITEVFRKKPGVLRSCHPTHSVCAFGPQAEYLVSQHAASLTPFDRFSPYNKLMDLNADILCLAVPIKYITFYHVFEDLVSNFPYKVYEPRPIRVLVKNCNDEPQIIETYCHREELAPLRIDYNDQVLSRVERKFVRAGILKQMQLGQTTSYLLNCKDIIRVLEEMLADGETIYV